MKKLWLAASLALLAAGCASRRGGSSYGYLVTDDGSDGCAFRYGFYAYYDPYNSGPNPARLEIVRVERPRLPHWIDRNTPWPHATARDNGTSSAPYQQTDREIVTTAAPPPATRVVEPRS